jgi:hypothetical protein
LTLSKTNAIIDSDVTWDASLNDLVHDNINLFFDLMEETTEHEYHFDQHWEYGRLMVTTHNIILEEEFFDDLEYVYLYDIGDVLMDLLHQESANVVNNVNLTNVAKVRPNFELLRQLFGWDLIDTTQRTFAVTTQYACRRVIDTLNTH